MAYQGRYGNGNSKSSGGAWKIVLIVVLCVVLIFALLFGAASVPAAALAMALAGALGPRMREERLQKGAIALFLLGGVSIIIKSIVFHT